MTVRSNDFLTRLNDAITGTGASTALRTSGSGGGGAPTDSQYVVLAADATLTNERVLTGTSNQVVITDNGAGGTVVLSLPQSIATASSPQFATLGIGTAAVANNGLTVLGANTDAVNPTLLSITGGTLTNITATAEMTSLNFNLAQSKTWATGAVATERFVRFQAPTIAANGASNFAAVGMMEIESPTAGSNVTFTGINGALRFGSSMTAPSVATFSYAAGRVPAHTITLTGSTQITAIPSATGLNIGALTITDASAITVDTAAGLFVAPPVAAGSVTLTNAWALYATGSIIATGLASIFGDGTTSQTAGSFLFTRAGSASLSIRLQNGNSGFTTNDGFEINLSSSSAVSLLNRESTAVNIGTSAVTRYSIDAVGRSSFTPGSAGSTNSTAFAFTAATDTNQTAGSEVNCVHFNMTNSTQHASNTVIATQRDFLITARSHSFVSAGGIITNGATLNVTAAPSASTNAAFTLATAIQAGGATTQVSAAGLIVRAIDVPAHTITVTGTTQVTSVGIAGIGIGQITITDASALTIDTSASLYIANAPVAAGSVTLTKTYSFWLDAGLPRIDSTSANGSVATVLGSVGPTGSNTTVQEWLTVDINGTTRYIPCF